MKKLHRRAMLKGLGGAAVALPTLNVMLDDNGHALAAGPECPQRYLVCSVGSSLGSGRVDINETYVPDTEGMDYDLKPALEPFAGGMLPSGASYDDVRSEISVITNMRIPWASMNGGTVPAGGRPDNHHETMVSPLLSGVRTPSGQSSRCFGPTSDQVVASAIGAGTRFESLQWGIQASSYLGSGGTPRRGVISYRDGGAIGTEGERLTPQVSPKAAYDELFYNFSTGMEDPAEVARRDFDRRTRASILDVVRTQADRLEARLGVEDRRRLERHFTEIRELELLIDMIGPEAEGQCELLADPGSDPAFGGNFTDSNPDECGYDYDRNTGYSNEDLRAEIFNRMIHMGFVCDLTRSISLMYTHFHSWMNVYSLIEREADQHQLGHSSHGTVGQGEILAWHYKHFASLVHRLRETPEGTGTVLDNCALVMTHEGGYGLDPSDGAEMRSHSTERMAALIAGRAGGLQQGQHIRTDNAHPAQVLISAMSAVGVGDGVLGEVEGVIPELFSA